jgi:hypothetical protein
MKQTHYLTTTVQAGNRLEFSLADLPVGKTVEVIVIIPDAPESNPVPNSEIDRRAFMKLPLEQRQEILAAQAKAMQAHYAQDADWQEWANLDMGGWHDET